MDAAVEIPERSRTARRVWAGFGLLSVGVGGVGAVVPGLPTTVFFVIAASCFSKSSPRLERWVLELPTIGPMVRDYRAGLGISRRTKASAIAMVVVVISISAGFIIDVTPVRIAVVIAGVVGVASILFVVPTRERVMAARSAAARPVNVA
jgi:hypothetical protein